MLLYALSIVLGGIIEAYIFNSIFTASVDFVGDSFWWTYRSKKADKSTIAALWDAIAESKGCTAHGYLE